MMVADLIDRMTWPEFVNWMAFYTWENDQATPPAKRRIRPKTKEQAANALDALFGVKRPAKR
jgi:hypothetical protein